MFINFKLFQKTEEKITIPNLLYETSVNLSRTKTPPGGGGWWAKKLQANNLGESRCKNLQ